MRRTSHNSLKILLVVNIWPVLTGAILTTPASWLLLARLATPASGWCRSPSQRVPAASCPMISAAGRSEADRKPVPAYRLIRS